MIYVICIVLYLLFFAMTYQTLVDDVA